MGLGPATGMRSYYWYGFNLSRLWQQTKKDIKMRIKYAPNSCNCLAD
jgi:hypothetical protein